MPPSDVSDDSDAVAGGDDDDDDDESVKAGCDEEPESETENPQCGTCEQRAGDWERALLPAVRKQVKWHKRNWSSKKKRYVITGSECYPCFGTRRAKSWGKLTQAQLLKVLKKPGKKDAFLADRNQRAVGGKSVKNVESKVQSVKKISTGSSAPVFSTS